MDILRSVRPPKIYIAIDGPRSSNPDEAKKVSEVLEIARSIDWTSDVRFLIREENLGCGRSVSSALDWFFAQEEQGIILEDDCYPSPDFFSFCNEMLSRYAKDSCIATIAGHSLIPSTLKHANGYFFSKYTQIWGWATWRRFWNTVDFQLNSLPSVQWQKIVCDHTSEGLERTYWIYFMEQMLNRNIDTWDFQVQLCAWRNDQVNINPGSNLVSNVGFREDATHTNAPSHLASRKVLSLSGPFPDQAVQVDRELDQSILMQLLFASEKFLSFLFRKQDNSYTQLIALNQTLTQAAEKHDSQLKELVSNLNESAEAYQARISALERQVAFYASRMGWIHKLADLLLLKRAKPKFPEIFRG